MSIYLEGLREKCRYIWQRIENEDFPVFLRHLHGHKGHSGNEAADLVAKYFAMTPDIFTGKRIKFCQKTLRIEQILVEQ